jgi:hypothetical protein
MIFSTILRIIIPPLYDDSTHIISHDNIFSTYSKELLFSYLQNVFDVETFYILANFAHHSQTLKKNLF